MTIHQTNHELILYLRALSASLDAELTTLLTTLSITRDSLTSIPATDFPKSATHTVAYDKLLDYATKISRYTQTATNNRNRVPPSQFPQEDSVNAIEETDQNHQEAIEGPRMREQDKDINDNTMNNVDQGVFGDKETKNSAMNPTDEEAAILDTSQTLLGAFAPWPSEETMRRGVLARMAVEGDDQALASQQEDQHQQQQLTGVVSQDAISSGGRKEQQQQRVNAEKQRAEVRPKENEMEPREAAVFTGLDLYISDDEA